VVLTASKLGNEEFGGGLDHQATG